MFKTIVEAVLFHSENRKDHLAVCFKSESLTYSELALRVYNAAGILRDHYGIGSQDTVMMSALSKPEYIVAWLATQYLGATVIPIDKAMTEQGVFSIYHLVKPKLFLSAITYKDPSVVSESIKDLYNHSIDTKPMTELSYELPDEDNIAEIIFTTGTTGEPKGAMLSYKGILHSTVFTRDGVKRNKDDIELLPLPLNHSYGLRVLRTLLYVGATVVLQNGFMFLKETSSNIEKYHCNGMAVVPASLEKLYGNLGDEFGDLFGKLEHIEISAGSLSVASKIRMIESLPNTRLINVWGSSETGGVIFLNIREDRDNIGSLGKPAEGVVISFLDNEGHEKKADSPENSGRMIMKGPMCMKGYYNRPDITANTLKDGFLYTSDVAYMNSNGYVYMLGRADDIINVGGEKVSPIEVENVCGLYENIEECACIGGIDKTGEYETIPVLYVVPSSAGFDVKEMLQFAASKLDQYKIPKAVEIVDAIPKNSMKKIDRKALKKLWESGDGDLTNPVVSAIYGRRSVRRFTDQPVPHNILEQIVKCGMQAPSGHNMQTWHFTVISDSDIIAELKTTIPPVAERNGVMFYGFENPPALILVSNDVRNPYGIQDSSCATQNIMLSAYSYGIGSVWLNPLMKICDEPEIRPLLTRIGVPEGYCVWSMIALGYPSNKPSPLAKKNDVVNWVE